MEIFDHIAAAIAGMGLFGLFLANYLMFAVFPLPSQIIVITAGYLASSGQMDLTSSIFVGGFGAFLGAMTNYAVGRSLGLKLVLKYGDYILINRQRIALLKLYFQKYGWISVFVGMVLPSIGQLISLPAGVGKMNIIKFTLSALTGAFIWNLYLLLIGYFVGESFLGSPKI